MNLKRLFAKLRSKKYRTAYIAEHIRTVVPFQIKALREQRNWTQGDLGRAAGKPQNVISRIEDPDYGKHTVQTLLDVAAGLDVALLIKFVPFSRFLVEYEDVTEASLEAASFEEERSAQEKRHGLSCLGRQGYEARQNTNR